MRTSGWISLAAAAGWLAATPAQASNMSVQVRQGPMRSAPSFTGQVLTSLSYGDRVDVIEKRPGWIRVSFGQASGWMHESALTPKRIVLQAGEQTAQTGASSEELALAGKGFNSEVEAQFKAQSTDVNYPAVDAMEKRPVTPQAMAEFRAAGGLR